MRIIILIYLRGRFLKIEIQDYELLLQLILELIMQYDLVCVSSSNQVHNPKPDHNWNLCILSHFKRIDW